MKWPLVLAVAVGGAVGSVLRYIVGVSVQSRVGTPFPVGTLLINITGSLLLGFVLRFALESAAVSAEARAFLTTGLCGGYTTFSTFSWETAALIDEGAYARAGLYIALSVGIGVLGIFAGMAGAHSLIAARRGG
jgi:fluoride exporter